MVLMYFGGLIFFEESFNLVTTPLRVENADGATVASDRLILDTICFYTFILMNVFNLINCRILEDQEMNPFKDAFGSFKPWPTSFNPYFWFIFILDIGVTEIMVWAA